MVPAKAERLREEASRLKADDNIIIRRHGVAHAMAAGLTGERMIPISTLTAIQLKLGVWWSPGFILFSYAGSKPFMGDIIEATQDPDAFRSEERRVGKE